MNRSSFVVAFVVAALLAGGATAAPTGQTAKKCPRGKARVTIAGKSSCKPLASVLPRRRAGNGLAPALRPALSPTWGETRNGPKTLAELVGLDSQRAVEEAIPRALARLKTLGSGRFALAVSATAAKCKYARTLPTTSETFKEDLGAGAKLEATMRTGADGATMSLGLTIPKAGGSAVRITVDLGLCSGERLEVDSCPTAQGVVEGSDNSDGTIKVEQLEDGGVVESTTTKVKVETKLRGQVGDDAKLDSIAINRSETYNTLIDYGRWFGAQQSLTVQRTGTIAMPSGRYTGTGSLDIQQKFTGPLSFLVNESAARAAAIAAAQKASDEAWSGFVDEVVKKYNEREKNGWHKANQCAEIDFTPRSNSIKVSPGQTGHFSGSVRAKRGGAPVGNWTLIDYKRLTVTPKSGRGATLRFNYRVVGDGNVSASFRLKSKAGLASGVWEQGGQKLPRRIAGSFSGSSGEGRYSWQGTITFVRVPERSSVLYAWYDVEKVSFSVTYLVRDFGCSGRSTATGSSGRQQSAYLLLVPKPDARGRHRYEMTGAFRTAASTISVTCAGITMTQPWQGVASIVSVPNTFYSDLKTFSGTNNVGGGATYTWDLHASG